MAEAVLYLPLATTLLAALFAAAVFRRYRARPGATHLLWWGLGGVFYGAGTLAEGLVAVLGWNEPLFRGWYITGALLGGAPLAQGTVYLLLPRRVAHRLTFSLVAFVTIASVFVLATPLAPVEEGTNRLSTSIIEWTWVRAFSPLINIYAATFLIGGAILSAIRFRRSDPDRAKGTALIAVGAILPGIGGSFARAGLTEVLYVTEFVGLALIFAGYRLSIRSRDPGRRSLGEPGAQVRPA